MPIPRFTSMPERNSTATRRAMIVWLSMVSALGYEIIDEWRRGYDVIGGDEADGNDVLGGYDHRVGRHRHHGIEVARGQRVSQIAEIVGQEGVDQREVRVQRGLDQIGFAVDLKPRLAVLD